MTRDTERCTLREAPRRRMLLATALAACTTAVLPCTRPAWASAAPRWGWSTVVAQHADDATGGLAGDGRAVVTWRVPADELPLVSPAFLRVVEPSGRFGRTHELGNAQNLGGIEIGPGGQPVAWTWGTHPALTTIAAASTGWRPTHHPDRILKQVAPSHDGRLVALTFDDDFRHGACEAVPAGLRHCVDLPRALDEVREVAAADDRLVMAVNDLTLEAEEDEDDDVDRENPAVPNHPALLGSDLRTGQSTTRALPLRHSSPIDMGVDARPGQIGWAAVGTRKTGEPMRLWAGLGRFTDPGRPVALTNGEKVGWLKIRLLPGGGALVVWSRVRHDDSERGQLRWARLSTGGRLLTRGVLSASERALNADIAVLDDGDALVAWTTDDGVERLRTVRLTGRHMVNLPFSQGNLTTRVNREHAFTDLATRGDHALLTWITPRREVRIARLLR